MSPQLLIIIGMGVVTFAIRLAPIVLLEKVTLPPLVRQGLRFVPPAVLTAIISPEMLIPGGQFDLSLGNFRLLAGMLAIVIAWRTRNLLATLAGGMLCLWLLQYFFPA